MRIKSNVRAGYYDRCGGYTRCGGSTRCGGGAARGVRDVSLTRPTRRSTGSHPAWAGWLSLAPRFVRVLRKDSAGQGPPDNAQFTQDVRGS
jgi:hypothetical protein